MADILTAERRVNPWIWFSTSLAPVESVRPAGSAPPAGARHSELSSLSFTTRSCGSLELLIRYSSWPSLSGSCLVTSYAPRATSRLKIVGCKNTVRPSLNLCVAILRRFSLCAFGCLAGVLVENLQRGDDEQADGLGATREIRLTPSPPIYGVDELRLASHANELAEGLASLHIGDRVHDGMITHRRAEGKRGGSRAGRRICLLAKRKSGRPPRRMEIRQAGDQCLISVNPAAARSACRADLPAL
jgi:hypothetical protein